HPERTHDNATQRTISAPTSCRPRRGGFSSSALDRVGTITAGPCTISTRVCNDAQRQRRSHPAALEVGRTGDLGPWPPTPAAAGRMTPERAHGNTVPDVSGSAPPRLG